MYAKNSEERLDAQRTRRSGAVAACAVLLVANQFLPVAMADDLICYSPADLNCDWVVDGQDLTYLLGGWGTETKAFDLDGNCTVDGADLAMMLASWGALPDMPDFGPIDFQNEAVSFCTGEESMGAVLNGSVYIDSMSGWVYGDIEVLLDDSVYASIQYQETQTIVMTGKSKLYFDNLDPSSTIYVNGMPHEIDEFYDDVLNDLQTHGQNPDEWDEYTQAMMAHTMLYQSDAYAMNMMAAQAAQQNNEPSYWCKAAAYSAGFAITALAAAGCIVLEGACAAGTVVTFGGIAIPCTALLGLCIGGVYLGGSAAYELALSYWAN